MVKTEGKVDGRRARAMEGRRRMAGHGDRAGVVEDGMAKTEEEVDRKRRRA